MKDAPFGRWRWLKVEFREFQEYMAQYNASRAKLYAGRSQPEVVMVAACNLGGLRLGKVALLWNERPEVVMGSYSGFLI